MRRLRKFKTVGDMDAAITADYVSFVGMVKDDGQAPILHMHVHKKPKPAPTNLSISCSENTVTITAENATTIEYKLSESGSYVTYTEPFAITQTVTVYAKATNAGGSITASQECVYFDPTIPFYIDVRGSVTLAATSGLQMSTDGENWNDTAATTLPTGKTYFRVASDQSNPLKPNWTEDENSDYDIGGNINSLVTTSFEEYITCHSFSSFFQDKTKLKSAGNLILPATTLRTSCYSNMFNGCTSLTTAPALPATTLAYGCYGDMFNSCTSLTTAPALPAPTLAENCYEYMFFGCTNLNYIKCLATNISASGCTSDWVYGVSATGTFVKDPNMTASTWGTGVNGIPSGWTVEDAQD